MNANHTLLVKLGVSSPALDRLVEVARAAGATGAKLSGAGQGGNTLALVAAENLDDVVAALKMAGATHTIRTTVA
jgi:mevalonate kinase